jgi:hypothetical protein
VGQKAIEKTEYIPHPQLKAGIIINGRLFEN